MTDFIPPYPPRFSDEPARLKRLWLASRNLIAMWEDKDFEREFSSVQVLSRRIFLCNSPDSVKFAFSTHNSSFERKSPQMRHALAPLLGDGLFISDGDIWRTRRRIVAPIVHVSRLSEFAPAMVGAANDARTRWMRAEGQTIDVLSESAALTADVICRALFGTQLSRDCIRERSSPHFECWRSRLELVVKEFTRRTSIHHGSSGNRGIKADSSVSQGWNDGR